MNINRFYVSIMHAVRGITYVFRHEQNFRIQIYVSLAVYALTWVFSLKDSERVVIMLLMILIIVLELVNSAIEKFTDIVKPRLHDHVAIVKDIMAGTVLLSSIGATILGLHIFFPYMIELFGYLVVQ
ncbi:MAG: diacylglycerol kinase [Candidatus Magasanikbacteria bacterium CG11_big_fil_rev_8_21_14_0_20_43_7]|uniref:Diacylglycerol kinase n=1 Tax=Candidatus Magasanikbacteria bacterium CG11_big_fil_rev_8_21_14_0_20_43_7 TaxID=1974654 RepID=A0A2H0N4F4_9BACT|nr:MAG: diacylglycerol kinase [Candidatus Magasanikbacteria bacterium CG11_big_fil_rev_8_21_14_0_20_43_7]